MNSHNGPRQNQFEPGYEETREFLDEYDEERVPELVKLVELMSLEVEEVEIEEDIDSICYEIKLGPEEDDPAASDMLENGELEQSVAGTFPKSCYKEVKEHFEAEAVI